MIDRAGGTIWLNSFATVLFTVCSAVTVECCILYPSLLGFGMGNMLANFHMCGIMLLLIKSSFKHARE